MSAEAIEKRWSSLRNVFSRESRRQKLPPSGSGYEPTKEWDLYRHILFLTPHIAHRRTKTSFVQQNQTQNALLETSSASDTSSLYKKFKQSSDSITSLSSYEHNYNASLFQSIEENKSSNIEKEETIMTTENLKRPASTLSNYSTTENLNRPASTLSNYTSSSTSSLQFSDPSTSSNSINFKNPHRLKSFKKITPEMDEFAKHRKTKDDQIDRDLAEASKEISAAMKAVSSQMYESKQCNNGYMSAIEEGLKYVPTRNKTQCLIEVLQVIQRYEER